MNPRQNKTKRSRVAKKTTSDLSRLRMNGQQLRAWVFIATLVLAGIAIVLRVDSPVVWTFLGMAIGRTGLRSI